MVGPMLLRIDLSASVSLHRGKVAERPDAHRPKATPDNRPGAGKQGTRSTGIMPMVLNHSAQAQPESVRAGNSRFASPQANRRDRRTPPGSAGILPA